MLHCIPAIGCDLYDDQGNAFNPCFERKIQKKSHIVKVIVFSFEVEENLKVSYFGGNHLVAGSARSPEGNLGQSTHYLLTLPPHILHRSETFVSARK